MSMLMIVGEGGVVNSCQRGEKEMFVCVHRYVCVAAGYQTRVLL